MNLSPDTWPPKKKCQKTLRISPHLAGVALETCFSAAFWDTGKQTPKSTTKPLRKWQNFYSKPSISASPTSNLAKMFLKKTSFNWQKSSASKGVFCPRVKTSTNTQTANQESLQNVHVPPSFVRLSTSWAISLIFSKGFCGAWPLFMYLSRDARMAEPPRVSRLQTHVSKTEMVEKNPNQKHHITTLPEV